MVGAGGLFGGLAVQAMPAKDWETVLDG